MDRMYVYIKDNRIYAKTEERKRYPWCVVIQCDYKKDDDLIREDNQIKRYTESKQYREDKNIKTLEEQNRELKAENTELRELADREIKSKLRKKWEELTEFDRQKYFSLYGK